MPKSRQQWEIKDKEIKAAFEGLDPAMFPSLKELGITSIPKQKTLPQAFRKSIIDKMAKLSQHNLEKYQYQARRDLLKTLGVDNYYQAIEIIQQQMIEKKLNSPSEDRIKSNFDQNQDKYTKMHVASTPEYMKILSVAVSAQISDKRGAVIEKEKKDAGVETVTDAKAQIVSNMGSSKEAKKEYIFIFNDEWKALTAKAEQYNECRDLIQNGKMKEFKEKLNALKDPLHMLISQSHLMDKKQFEEAFQQIIKVEGKRILNKADSNGITPLKLASEKGDELVVAALLKEGAKTTNYQRGIVTRLWDTAKGVLDGSAQQKWRENPPRSLSGLSRLLDSKNTQDDLTGALIVSKRRTVPFKPEPVPPPSPTITTSPKTMNDKIEALKINNSNLSPESNKELDRVVKLITSKYNACKNSQTPKSEEVIHKEIVGLIRNEALKTKDNEVRKLLYNKFPEAKPQTVYHALPKEAFLQLPRTGPAAPEVDNKDKTKQKMS